MSWRGEKEQQRIVVVFPHWGVEYSTDPRGIRAAAALFAQNGAAAVIGAHPHVVGVREEIDSTVQRADLPGKLTGRSAYRSPNGPPAIGGPPPLVSDSNGTLMPVAAVRSAPSSSAAQVQRPQDGPVQRCAAQVGSPRIGIRQVRADQQRQGKIRAQQTRMIEPRRRAIGRAPVPAGDQQRLGARSRSGSRCSASPAPAWPRADPRRSDWPPARPPGTNRPSRAARPPGWFAAAPRHAAPPRQDRPRARSWPAQV